MIRLRIREVAEACGVTSASDLARRTGVAFATANRLWKNELGGENDRGIGLLTLYRVAKALGVAVGDLYLEEDRRAPWFALRSLVTNQGAESEAAGMVAAIPALHP